MHQFWNAIQIDRLGVVAASFTCCARSMVGLCVALPVLGFINLKVSLAIAMVTLDKDLRFDHQLLLFVV
jgi:hypothetical protein